jgi:hypothetical protein
MVANGQGSCGVSSGGNGRKGSAKPKIFSHLWSLEMSVYLLFCRVLAARGGAGQGGCAHSGMTLDRSVEVRAKRVFRQNVPAKRSSPA